MQSYFFLFLLSTVLAVPAATNFSWENLTPSKDLNWVPCFGNFTCARLEVPLDYEDLDAGTTAIAFTKWSSPNKTAKDILLNPGGPGDSGVDMLIHGLSTLLQSVGTSNNLVGFDIRGVNNSGPDISCFPGSASDQKLYDALYFNDFDTIDDRELGRRWTMAEGYGKQCSKKLKGGPAKYANTVAIAADMLRYVETVESASGGKASDAKLRFWGLSYGTILGATFAALYPDRVDRIILDGNAEEIMYWTGTWNRTLVQADEAFNQFFKTCFEGGDACAIWEPSVELVAQRFNNLLTALSVHPISVVSDAHLPVVVTDTNLRYAFLAGLIRPIDVFPALAIAVKELEQRNGTTLAQLVGLGNVKTHFAPGELSTYVSNEAQAQISCNDQNGRIKETLYDLKSFRQYMDFARKQSAYMGDSGSYRVATSCAFYDVRPPKNQQFNAWPPSAKNTSTPLLIIGNTIDPTTPIVYAREQAARFPGSVVLEQNNVGHTSLAAPSKCTAKYIQAYLNDGTLPPVNTTCEVDLLPFQTAA
ncbi:hypothetical protein K491DRAFT_7274 [Lophiostoma macrostomum CBS 122681]|uniref:Uncharacterized protein n=1 Tax=Lophiostoma macrostomum CBS 122681 TaxID=1314788 RepID=A0A6A6TVP5_9PLEO|nr:hypothetical protein K491DRAFT_7274 [Lophiostoma macrostomum CBS 122681]